MIDGRHLRGFLVEDFTLAELNTLRATERLPDLRQENTIYDGRDEVPTFPECSTCASGSLAPAAAQHLHVPRDQAPDLPRPDRPVAGAAAGARAAPRQPRPPALAGVIQSFEVTNLVELDRRIEVPIVQLLGSSGSAQDLVEVGIPATYTDSSVLAASARSPTTATASARASTG